jgi:hypothetical protein
MAETVNKITYIIEGSQATAEAAKISAGMDGIGKAAASSAATSTAAINQVEGATKGVAVSSAQANQILENLAKTAGINSEQYKQMAAALGQTTTATQQNTNATRIATETKAQYAKAEREIAQLAKTFIAQENNATTAVKESVSEWNKYIQSQVAGLNATKTATGEVDKNATAHKKGSSAVNEAGEGWSKLTTRINVGRGALAGYDAAIEGIVRGFGGLQLGWAVAIGLAAALLPKIISLVSAHKDYTEVLKDLMKIDDEALRLEAARLATSANLVEAGGRQARVDADMQAILLNYNAVTEQLTAAQIARASAQEHLSETQRLIAQGVIPVLAGDQAEDQITKQLTTSIAGLDTQILTLQKSQQDQIKLAVTFGQMTGRNTEAIRAQAASIPNLTKNLIDLNRQLDEGAQLALQFAIELNKLSIPKFDISKTGAGITAQAQAVRRGIQDLAPGSLAAAQLGIKSFDDTVRTLSPTLRALSEDTKNNKAAFDALDPTVRTAVQRYRELNDHHKSGAGSARSQALAENQLTKAIADARAALTADDFKGREEKIRADIAAERNALLIKKRLTAAAQSDLAELESLRIEKVNLDREKAVAQSERTIRDMRIAAIKDAEEQARQRTDADIDDFRAAQIEKFGISKQADDLSAAYAKQRIADFETWRLQYHENITEKIFREDERLMRETLRETQAAIDEIENARELAAKKELDRFEKQQRQFIELSERFARRGPGGALQLPDAGQVEAIRKALEALNLTVADVDSYFGTASTSIEQFARRLDIVQGKIVSTGAAFRAFFSDLILSIEFATVAFQAFGQMIATIFEGLVTGEENAKSAFLNFLASILMWLGSMAIAAGTVFLFLPGHHGLGVALIAAGIAAMALGGVLRGLASNAQKKPETAGASAAAGAAPAATVNPPIAPNVIPFPTSGQGQTINVTLQLDRSGTKDLLGGKPITEEGARGPQARLISRAARKGAG